LDSPLISVVIPNYNYGRYLFETINSVLDQSYPNLEVIVIDDGSTDNSADVLRQFEGKIIVEYLSNGGQARARNRGLEISSGTFVALLDADDLWMPDKIQNQFKLMSSEILFSFTGLRQFDDKTGQTLQEITPLFRGWCADAFLDFPTRAIVPGGESSVLFHRSLISNIGNFDEKLETAAGRDFYRRCARVTKFNFTEEKLVHQRMHLGSMSRNRKLSMRDTFNAYRILFEDPEWKFASSRKREVYLRLEWSFIKTWLKTGNILETFKSCFHFCRFLVGWY